MQQIDHFKYILKVAEELLYNACPPELIQKYEMLKQISQQKLGQYINSNGEINNQTSYSNQNSIQPNSQQQSGDKFCLQLLESMMECIGLFLDVFQTINYSGGQQNQLKDFSHKIGEFNEITSKILIGQQQKQQQLQIKEPYISKNIYKFDKLTQNMVRALYDLDNYIVQNDKQINQQNEMIVNYQQQLKKINIEYEIQSQRSIQKQQIENIELNEKVKILNSENDQLLQQINEKKKSTDRQEFQIESQKLKILELQKQMDEQRMRINSLEKDLQEKQLKSIQSNIPLEIHHKKIDELNAQINNLSKQQSELSHFYKVFKDEFNIYITKYKDAYHEFQKKNNSTIQQDEKLNLLLFIAYLFQKFEGDNMWLVEQLTEFGKENDNLKIQNKDMFNEVHYLQDSLKNSSSLDNVYQQLQRELEYSSKQLNLFSDSKNKLKDFLLQSETKASQQTHQSFN